MDKKVNLFLIGASKCGTTSLWNMLNHHPDVFMSKPKEPFFFSFSDYQSKLNNYNKLFENVKGQKIIGEATPIYSETTLIPELPMRLHNYNKNSKIIYLVRNPIERLKSAWRQLLYTGHDRRVVYNDYTDVEVSLMPNDFIKAIYEHPNFIEATRYKTHLNNYLNFFSKKNIKVFYFEDMKENPRQFFKEVCEFLDIDFIEKEKMFEVKNPSLGRKRNYNFVNFIRKNEFIFNLGRSIKDSLNLSDKYFNKEIKYDILIEEEDYEKILKTLKDEIEGLLIYTNKSKDFWKL